MPAGSWYYLVPFCTTIQLYRLSDLRHPNRQCSLSTLLPGYCYLLPPTPPHICCSPSGWPEDQEMGGPDCWGIPAPQNWQSIWLPWEKRQGEESRCCTLWLESLLWYTAVIFSEHSSQKPWQGLHEYPAVEVLCFWNVSKLKCFKWYICSDPQRTWLTFLPPLLNSPYKDLQNTCSWNTRLPKSLRLPCNTCVKTAWHQPSAWSIPRRTANLNLAKAKIPEQHAIYCAWGGGEQGKSPSKWDPDKETRSQPVCLTWTKLI